jgi:energy-coupling factor transporter transmembrane protein EcfT
LYFLKSVKRFRGSHVNTNMDIIGTDNGNLFQYTVFKIEALLPAILNVQTRVLTATSNSLLTFTYPPSEITGGSAEIVWRNALT